MSYEIEPVDPSPKQLLDLFEELTREEAKDFSERLKAAQWGSGAKQAHVKVSHVMGELAQQAGFSLEEITFGETSDDEGVAIYIEVGHMDSPTLIYCYEDREFYVEAYSDFVESIEPQVFQIPYHIEDEAGHVFNSKAYVQAEDEDAAVEYFIGLIEDGDEGIWGEDDNFDLGGVERTERKGTKPENQMWYVTGFDQDQELEDDEDPETLTKALRFDPENIKQIALSDASGEHIYEAD